MSTLTAYSTQSKLKYLTGLTSDVQYQIDSKASQSSVDSSFQLLQYKQSVRVATTANITLSGTQTIDGVAVVANDRVLVKNQTTGSQNGIYVVASGAWARATDADTSGKMATGTFVVIQEGSTNADTAFILTTNSPITLGSTSLSFSQISGGGGGGVASISGTTNQINASASTGAVTLSLPQNIDTAATPTFTRLTLSQTTGTPPLAITSTTLVNNLNADKVDGYDFDQDVRTTASPTFINTSVSSLRKGTLRVNEQYIGTFTTTAVANNKIDLYCADSTNTGVLDVKVVGAWNVGNVNGTLIKRFSLNVTTGGTINYQEAKYVEASGAIASKFAISDITWDATNTRWRIQLAQLDATVAGNYSVHIIWQSALASQTMATGLTLGTVYATDSTVLSTPAIQFTKPFASTVATGTAPFTVASTNVVNNLNADLLDGQDGTYYTNPSNLSSAVGTAKGGTGLTSIGITNQVLGVNSGATGLEYKTVTAGNGINVTHGANSVTIANSGTLSSTLTINPTNSAGTQDGIILTDSGTGSSEGLRINWRSGDSGSVDLARIAGVSNVSGSGGYLTFFTNSTTAGTIAERMRIDKDGNIGIGTTSPSEKLNVSGNILSTGTITGTQLISNIATGTPPLSVTSTTKVTNLNVDLLDDQDGSYYLALGNATGTLATSNGGTGLTSIGTANQILGVNTGATGLEYKTVTAGTGISITPAANSISVANTGVTNITGTANQVTASASTGSVTLSLPQSIATTSTPTFGQITISNSPTNSTDVATKGYVDSIAQGLEVKTSVRVATTANITLSGTQTIDGVAVVAGDRVLVKGQTTGSQNGIYIVSATAWSRSTDADTSAEVTAGMFTFVEEGTTNADSGWVLTTNNPITLGTTALSFAQFSGAGQITAGDGLTKSGNTLNVVGTAGRIVANADSIDLATVGSPVTSSFVKITTDNYGRVSGTTAVSGTDITSQLTAGTGITIGSGSITNSGVTGITGTANQITASASTGSITLSLPQSIATTSSPTFSTVTATTFSGNATTATTATNITGGAAGSIPYQTASATTNTLGIGTAKQALVVNAGATAPSWTELDLTYLPTSAFKKSAKVATTANITLSGTQTIDGVAVVAGDRVLVKDQTTSSQNGIYIVSASAWTRATDADASNEIDGATVNIDQGTVNGGYLFSNVFKATDTVGTTAMPWYRLLNSNDTSLTATASTIVIRDASGRITISDPSASTDAATKNYVDSSSRVNGKTVTISATAPSTPSVNDIWFDLN